MDGILTQKRPIFDEKSRCKRSPTSECRTDSVSQILSVGRLGKQTSIPDLGQLRYLIAGRCEPYIRRLDTPVAGRRRLGITNRESIQEASLHRMRIGEFTLSCGLMVNALRSIGLALDSVADALSNPHHINFFIELHRRSMPARHWVGLEHEIRQLASPERSSTPAHDEPFATFEISEDDPI